jgi:hypothetical protein
VAYRARWRLAAAGREAADFLRRRLLPVSVIESRRLTSLIGKLDSEDFAVRTRAMKDLEELREAAEPALRAALRDRPSPELRRRLEKLLDHLSPFATARLRELRAVAVLESVGTAEARALLKAIAEGAPEARLTQEAKATLARLERRPTK